MQQIELWQLSPCQPFALLQCFSNNIITQRDILKWLEFRIYSFHRVKVIPMKKLKLKKIFQILLSLQWLTYNEQGSKVTLYTGLIFFLKGRFSKMCLKNSFFVVVHDNNLNIGEKFPHKKIIQFFLLLLFT